jgi:hypothetical protein
MGVPRRSKPVPVRDLLVAAVPELREHFLATSIRESWNQVAGPELSRRSRPARLRAGVLDVTVDNSPCLHEMTLRSGALLAALQSRYPSAVGSLKLALGPPAKAGEARTAARRAADPPARLSREESRQIQTAVASVTDSALAASLRRLLTKDILARRPPGPMHRPGDSRRAARGDS